MHCYDFQLWQLLFVYSETTGYESWLGPRKIEYSSEYPQKPTVGPTICCFELFSRSCAIEKTGVRSGSRTPRICLEFPTPYW